MEKHKMKLNELKSELKEKEKGCGSFVPYWERNCGQFEDLKHSDHYIYCPTCKAKIEYLKKGISACEEMLKLKDEWKSGWELEFRRIYNKKLKKALSQRNKEILEIINELLDNY